MPLWYLRQAVDILKIVKLKDFTRTTKFTIRQWGVLKRLNIFQDRTRIPMQKLNVATKRQDKVLEKQSDLKQGNFSRCCHRRNVKTVFAYRYKGVREHFQF